MSVTEADDLRAAMHLLSDFNGRANGKPLTDIFGAIIGRPILPADVMPVVQALADLRAAEAAEEAAYAHRRECEIRLAEIVGVRRRDKDTGFDAEFKATQMIVAAATEATMAANRRKSSEGGT